MWYEVEKMKKAASYLGGEHDFKYSCSHRICLCFLSFLYDERPYIHGSEELQHFTE